MLIFFAISAALLGGIAGITAGKLLNKAGSTIATVGGLLPAGSLDVVPNDPTTNKPNYLRIVIVAALFAIGFLIVKFVGKKLGVKFLK